MLVCIAIQFAIMLALCSFTRTCIVKKDGSPIARAGIFLLAILGLVPVLGTILIAGLGVNLSDNTQKREWVLKDNRFTRYWFKS